MDVSFICCDMWYQYQYLAMCGLSWFCSGCNVYIKKGVEMQ